MPLIYLSCAWIIGIYLGLIYNLPLPVLLICLVTLPLPFVLRRHRKSAILIALSSLLICGGILRFQPELTAADAGSLQYYNGQGVTEIKGVIDDDPETGDKTTHLRFSAREVKANGEWHEVTGSALLYVRPYPTYSYGDVLLVTGELEEPPQFEDFDYADYLARQGIYSTVLYPRIEVVDTGQGNPFLGWVYSLRHRLADTIAEVLPEPQASLVQGVVLGMRSNIPESLRTDFARSGTTHLLAISGLHLSIVTGILLAIGSRLFGRRYHIYIWLALVAIWSYAVITGMNPPVVRAAIMASLFLAAELLGRQRSAITALTFAGAVMVGISPQILWDASFQLSFLAMVGLIFVAPWLQAQGRRTIGATLGESGIAASVAGYISDTFCVTLGIIVIVWPLIAYYFGIVSLVAPLATFLALPALPGIIVTGALAAGLGIIALPIAQVVGWLAWLFASYMLAVVSGMAAFPLSSIDVGTVDARLVWACYVVTAGVIWVYRRRPKLSAVGAPAINFVERLPKKWLLPPLLVVAVLSTTFAISMPDENLHVSFLDVGQGDAILIQTPGHQDILVDGGPSPHELNLVLGRQMPFWDRTIDLVVLTHPHADHITGLIDVLQRYRVKHVLFTHVEYQSPLYDEWLRTIEEQGIECTFAQAGQQIDTGTGGVTIEVLHPEDPLPDSIESDGDDIGVVLRVCYGQVSFLLTADVSQEVEAELIKHRANLSSTVLKVGHHGSNTSTGAGFLATVDPTIAVISVGADNTFGHPDEEVLARLEERIGGDNIYRTDEQGTIEFVTDGERLWVEVER
ncbi:MAG TPA: DNA internalization-related competence protein ComEC/Rec2 [Dehalococcoidia bacterium]|nr:DNA internalization-related competence protein ComEC/Rec2 [Dehalococcoidia bacterium]